MEGEAEFIIGAKQVITADFGEIEAPQSVIDSYYATPKNKDGSLDRRTKAFKSYLSVLKGCADRVKRGFSGA